MDIGTGTTVAFATTSFAPQVTNVSWDGISREAIDSSHMNSVVANGHAARTSIHGDMYDPGELTLEIWFVAGEVSGVTEMWKKPAETMTLTYPDGGTFVASVFCTAFSLNDPLEDGMTATITFKIADDITITG